MNLLAAIASFPEVIVGAFITACPFLLLGALVWWVIRLITTLRGRLDAIEDKLELLVLAQELKQTNQPKSATPSSLPDSP